MTITINKRWANRMRTIQAKQEPLFAQLQPLQEELRSITQNLALDAGATDEMLQTHKSELTLNADGTITMTLVAPTE